jgi:hypothetical protein
MSEPVDCPTKVNLMAYRRYESVPESEFSFDKCLGFLLINTEVSVDSGIRI